MREDTFKFGEVYGKIKTLPKREADFVQALYLEALAKFYPALRVAPEQISTSQYVILSQALEFAATARHIVDLYGLPFGDFPSPYATPEAIDAAFKCFLSDETDLWEALATAIKVLERPNGVAGAHPDQLTEAEKKAPTLPEAEPSTSEA